jgi:Mor family transcriptional regulator
MEWTKELVVEDFEEPYSTLAEQLGVDVALLVIEMFQGQQVYFPKVDKVCNTVRKSLIRSEFNGYNYRELAEKFNYTTRYIRIICEDLVNRERSKPLENQMSLFETDNC